MKNDEMRVHSKLLGFFTGIDGLPFSPPPAQSQIYKAKFFNLILWLPFLNQPIHKTPSKPLAFITLLLLFIYLLLQL